MKIELWLRFLPDQTVIKIEDIEVQPKMFTLIAEMLKLKPIEGQPIIAEISGRKDGNTINIIVRAEHILFVQTLT